MMPYFSIIIPTYNAGKSVEIAISSILGQTFGDFEIIIIDGLSTDSTMNIVQRLAMSDTRLTFGSESDLGIYDAMNKGVEKANGQLLFFLGADDKLYDQNVLQDIYDASRTSKYSFYYGSVKVDGDSHLASNGGIYAGEFDLEKLLKQNICQQAIFYKRELFDRLGFFNLDFKLWADWDFNFRCFSKGRIKFIDRIISVYSTAGMSSRSIDSEFLNMKASLIAKYFQNELYKDAFTNIRYAMRKSVFDRQSKLDVIERIKVLFGLIVLQSKVWLKRLN